MPTCTARQELKPILAAAGSAVRGLREERGYARRELAARSGVSERFLAELEAGSGNISLARLDDVARALGMTAGELLAPPQRTEKRPGAQLRALLDGLSRDELVEAHRLLRARFQKGAGPLVALIGLRGAGKSTIGRALAAHLRLPFVELDALVEREAGLSLAAIFSLHGEAYYRRLAREALARFLGETGAAVIATGGSIVSDRDAFRLLQKRCRTVWLQASPEDHWRRVLAQGDVRPSAAGPHAQDELRALLRAREPLYAQAELAVDTSALGVPGAVARIARALKGE